MEVQPPMPKKNTSFKAGQMEVEAGKMLFERSLQKRNMWNPTVVCDGDSCTYNAIRDAKVYGYVEVQKEDCINHVQKEEQADSGTQLVANTQRCRQAKLWWPGKANS
ncbi:hypothetical protein HPB48_005067 [Haemaphysalis longicornis]|uniref:Mutator-like transposase domain-containing protein n=1 Tax=Haemaphysalis longicornis TaxID=44386 RepID=A0A9J6FIR7_HAELO|nr:hypothetical protein HPB48_005067 [Haemaphysalis longicornis]